jgi:epoxide hydrolase-like predicted phosphatase
MTNQYSVVFFDWSGVVADDSGDEFIRQLFRNAGATDNQIKKIIDTHFENLMLGRISEIEFWQKLKIDYCLNIKEPTSKEFKKWRGLEANNDILMLASKIKNRGIQVAVLTNIIEPVYCIIEQAGYYRRFDQVIASCKVGLTKPHKEIYLLALQQFNIVAQRAVFIDDKQVNLDTADYLGFKTILAQNPSQIINDVQKIIK